MCGWHPAWQPLPSLRALRWGSREYPALALPHRKRIKHLQTMDGWTLHRIVWRCHCSNGDLSASAICFATEFLYSGIDYLLKPSQRQPLSNQISEARQACRALDFTTHCASVERVVKLYDNYFFTPLIYINDTSSWTASVKRGIYCSTVALDSISFSWVTLINWQQGVFKHICWKFK